MDSTVLTLGSKMPDFSLPATDGRTYSSSSFSNAEVLIIIFSCNHCPYVQAYENRIIQIQKKYKENGVQVVAINSNDAVKYPEDSFSEMQKRAEEKGFNFPYLYDETQDIARAFGATHTPELFVFNKERKLVYFGKIDDNWQNETRVRNKYLENALDELLSGKTISVPETFAIGCTIKWK